MSFFDVIFVFSGLIAVYFLMEFFKDVRFISSQLSRILDTNAKTLEEVKLIKKINLSNQNDLIDQLPNREFLKDMFLEKKNISSENREDRFKRLNDAFASARSKELNNE